MEGDGAAGSRMIKLKIPPDPRGGKNDACYEDRRGVFYTNTDTQRDTERE